MSGSGTGETSPRKQHRDWHDYVTTVFTVAAFIAAVAAAVFTGMAACYTRNQWITAVDVEKRSLRAYISTFHDAMNPNATLSDTEVSVTVQMKNSGQTPAYHVKGWILLGEASGPTAPSITNEPTDVTTVATGLIGPGTTFVFRNSLRPAEMAPIRNRSHAVVVKGKVEYDDAFGEHHFTNFRFIITPRTRVNGETWTLQPTNDDNEAN